MYWALCSGFCIGKCIAGWLLAAGCLLLLLSFSFSFFISSHFISFHLISSLISCHVPSGDEMDQYLKVDQWQKKSEKESKKDDEQKEDQNLDARIWISKGIYR